MQYYDINKWTLLWVWIPSATFHVMDFGFLHEKVVRPVFVVPYITYLWATEVLCNTGKLPYDLYSQECGYDLKQDKTN
jgi:hypothetical protein